MSDRFGYNSRYAGIETAQRVLPRPGGEAEKVVYLRRRFVPQPDSFALLQEHAVIAGERLDHLAYRYLGDPEAFWRLCDANNALHPDDLTEPPGRLLRITLPAGIPGSDPNA